MSHTVLIVDDQIADSLASSLKECPNTEDIEFRIASDGAQCLTMVTAVQPDLVLLDYKIPVINGLTVMAELQKRKIRTRIIMMSGDRTDLSTAIECVKAGACDYIVKERQMVQPAQLLERIRRALLVENTLNLHISDLPASAKSLIDEASLLKDDYERLKTENNELKKKLSLNYQKFVLETLQKILYVVFSCAAVLFLRHIGMIPTSIVLPVIFLVLVILLLLPAERIRNITTSIKGMYGRIEIDRSGEQPNNGESSVTKIDKSSSNDEGQQNK